MGKTTSGGEATDQVGSGAAAAAATTNPSTEQVTQTGDEKPAEGQKIREAGREAREKSGVTTLSDALSSGVDSKTVHYDDSGRLVNADGKPIALAADASDPDVGWTAQQAGKHLAEGDKVHSSGGPSTVPDQTVHPDELPDPISAVKNGLLPQNAGVLNVDPGKFDGKKPIEA